MRCGHSHPQQTRVLARAACALLAFVHPLLSVSWPIAPHPLYKTLRLLFKTLFFIMSDAIPAHQRPRIVDCGDISLTTIFNHGLGIHELSCDLCTRVIKLDKRGTPNNFLKHRNACQKDHWLAIGPSLGTPLPAAPTPTLSRLAIPSAAASSTNSSPASREGTPTPTTPATAQHHTVYGRSPSLHGLASSFSGLSTTSPMPLSRVRTRPDHPCPGFRIHLEHLWDGYAFGVHQTHDMGWTPERFDDSKNELVLRASGCTRKASVTGEACPRCLGVKNSHRFTAFIARANSAPEHTSHELLTAAQLRALVRRVTMRLRQLTTEVMSHLHSINVFLHICGCRTRI
jgi:hypothetical protein